MKNKTFQSTCKFD